MKRSKAFYLIPLGIFCLLVLQYCYFTDFKQIRLRKAKCLYEETQTPKNAGFKNILYWTGVFGYADFYLGFGSKIFEGCEVSNCYATDNRCYLPVDQFDAILFHGREYLSESYDKPENRSSNQYYIYVNQESPVNTPLWTGSDHFFNWTMTYRLDSDVPHPYGYYENITTDYEPPTVEEVNFKPYKIAWMVSNCNAESNRNELYEELNKYIPVDVYGSCGTKSCSKDDFGGCHDMLEKNYKFYLSFENSICEQYVTEKMYAVLRRDFVPIVYGGADYSKVSPPNSVIDALKFKTVKELADYIKFLDANPKMYLSYFEWKKKYVVQRDHKLAVCNLCKKLHEPIVHKSYDINKWWNKGSCKLGDKVPKFRFT